MTIKCSNLPPTWIQWMPCRPNGDVPGNLTRSGQTALSAIMSSQMLSFRGTYSSHVWGILAVSIRHMCDFYISFSCRKTKTHLKSESPSATCCTLKCPMMSHDFQIPGPRSNLMPDALSPFSSDVFQGVNPQCHGFKWRRHWWNYSRYSSDCFRKLCSDD